MAFLKQGDKKVLISKLIESEIYECPKCKDNICIFDKNALGKIYISHYPPATCDHLKKQEDELLAKVMKMFESVVPFGPLMISKQCHGCNLRADAFTLVKPKIVMETGINYIKIKHDNTIYTFYISNTQKVIPICAEPWFEFSINNILDDPFTLNCVRGFWCAHCREVFANKGDDVGKIYFNQRGAGCGKTYESVLLLRRSPENIQFMSKRTYIYLTKLHSAKEVIINELKVQQNNGFLDNLQLTENKSSRQHKVRYFDRRIGESITILIGTVDSFNYAISNRHLNLSSDYFQNLVETIQDGINEDDYGNVNYSMSKIAINKSCLIIIDEGQDLSINYALAYDSLCQTNGVDFYIIGDKLQSIWNVPNVFTDHSLLETTIIKSLDENRVMRFHNKEFMHLVNKVIHFDDYGLPLITNIREQLEPTNEIPYEIFYVPKIYANDHNRIHINSITDKVINLIDRDVNQFDYLPEDFMILFPILSANILARELEERIQEYWINKFTDPLYQKIVSNDLYWNTHHKNKFNHFVKLHTSNQYTINLKESEKATRIMSIHSSKGSGRNVVFVLGLSESSLQLFSKTSNNLIYESLLHVALTRQKRALYVGIENNNDDINQRFSSFCNIVQDETLNIDLSIIRPHHLTSKFSKCEFNRDDYSDISIMQQIIPNASFILLWEQINKSFLIQREIFINEFLLNIINYKLKHNVFVMQDQIISILRAIVKKDSKRYYFKQYRTCLKNITNEKYMPILILEHETLKYNEYLDQIENAMIGARIKISQFLTSLSDDINNACAPVFTPFENLVVAYMREVTSNNIYAHITMLDLYAAVESNINHLDCLISNQVSLICDSFIKKFNKMTKNNYIMRFNTNYAIYYGENTVDRNICLYDVVPLIAYSDKHVIQFIICQKTSEEFLSRSILNETILNHMSANKPNYHNKKVLTCVVSLDQADVSLYDLNVNKKTNIKPIIAHILSEHQNYHEIAYNFYSRSTVITSNSKLPTYIDNYLCSLPIDKKIEKSEFCEKLTQIAHIVINNYFS